MSFEKYLRKKQIEKEATEAASKSVNEIVGKMMISEFENSLGHTDGFHDGYVKWNELSNQYESSDEDYLDVAEWMNGALAIYEKRQNEVDELTKQRDSFIKAYEIEMDKIDELQKRVDASLIAVEKLEQALKEGKG